MVLLCNDSIFMNKIFAGQQMKENNSPSYFLASNRNNGNQKLRILLLVSCFVECGLMMGERETASDVS